MNDRVGIGWRPELAAGIFAHCNEIDLVEVIADDYFNAPRQQIRALTTLASEMPVALHGVGLGLATCLSVQTQRIEKLARLIDVVQPEFWSEHLAFVRAGTVEIGHLAAPPRTVQTIEGTRVNVELAARLTGRMPLLENIATLIDPPASALDEAS